MKKFCSVCFALFAAFTASAENSAPIKVSISDLFNHPKRYNGKRVDLTGYWVTSCAHCSDLYPSFEVEQKQPYGTFISLGDLRPAKMPFFFRARLTSRWGEYDGYVRVVGTFRYTPIPKWVGKPVSPQPKSENALAPSSRVPPTEASAERVLVWGWNGPPVKQIVDIAEFNPVGPPLPSKIEKYDEEQVRKGLEESKKLRRPGI